MGRWARASEPHLRASVDLECAAEIEAAVGQAHRVSFRGPPLSRQSRAALAAAEITVIERLPIAAWCGQLNDYVVGVYAARTREEAIARVKAVVTDHGRYDEFSSVVELE